MHILCSAISLFLYRYDHIFFVDGSARVTIRGDLESAIRSLDEHQQDTYEDALAFLSTQSSGEWLYIIDNADDPEINLTPYLPSCSHGTIIITSRNRKTRHLATTQHIELGAMSQHEAIETLAHAAQRKIPLSEDEMLQARILVGELGCLALAIVQAGIYISEMSSEEADSCFTFEQYLSLFQRHREQLLRQTEHMTLDRYPKGVYASLDLSYSRLPEPSRQFLHMCAFLRHANIVAPIFSSATYANFGHEWRLMPRDENYRDLKTRLGRLFCRDGQWDELGFNDILQSLNSFSLVSISSIHDVILLRFHPLVHSYARDKLTAEEQRIYKQMTITCTLSNHSLPQRAYQYMLPHYMFLYRESGGDLLDLNDMARLGQLIWAQKDHKIAEEIFRKVIDHIANTKDSDANDVITTSGWLASILHDQGKWNEAEALEKQVLVTCQREFGPEHTQTLRSSAWLASTFREQGKWNEAEALQRDVLAGFQRTIGPEHPDTIAASALLAYTLLQQGKFDQAEIMEREVLAKRQDILGPEHIDTLSAASDLASSLYLQRRFSEAEIMHREILAIRQKVLGPEHTDTLSSSSNLANVFVELGKLDEAEVLGREVLASRQRIFGREHRDAIRAASDLASTLVNLGKLDEAEVIQRDVLAMRERVLGRENLDTIKASSDLASIFYKQGNLDDTEILKKEVLALREKILGPEHPDTLEESAALVETLYCQGKLKEAEVLAKELLDKRERVLGEKHLDTLTTLQLLGRILYSQNHLEEAFLIILRASNIAESVIGLDSSDILPYWEELGQCYGAMGKNAEAAEVRARATRVKQESQVNS
jgi:tetratricopeptide (TPR) repeat protein